MLTDRIVGAFTFRRGVYTEVERDTTFTPTAWLIVIVVSFLSQLGSNAGRPALSWILGAIIGTIFAVIGFAVAALVISWVGRAAFNADVTFDELVRTLGLAYVWNVISLLGVLGAITPVLSCLIAPLTIAGAIAALIAWFVAAHEALDLDWGRTIITVILGYVALVLALVVSGIFVGLIAAALGVLSGL